ncbi:MAG: hypothetical protein HQM08_15585 [Candidatus Riflebacteria bacterium]|nr:hypothetical protein [Candidatus Riflebacteria bacterium]
MGRHRYCELPFCNGVIKGTRLNRNKRRCDNDRNIHLHHVISDNVKKIMRYIESREEFTVNDVTRDLFKNILDKNQKGSMYRLFQAMVREDYLKENGKREGLKLYLYRGKFGPRFKDSSSEETNEDTESTQTTTSRVKKLQPSSEVQIADPARAEPIKFEQLIAKLKEFVHMKNGAWDHNDWLWLINRSDIKEFGQSDHQLGTLLEAEKSKYWNNR